MKGYRAHSRATRRAASAGEALASHDRWLLSYADFVTLLLAVFIVLFATAWRNRQTLATVSSSVRNGFESLGVAGAVPNAVPGAVRGKPSAAVPVNTPVTTPLLGTSALLPQLQAILGDSIRLHDIALRETPEGLVISLRESGFFSSGQAALLPSAEDTVRRTAEVLRQHGLVVRVEGHSDDQPIHTAQFSSNWELSTARAMSVLSVFLNAAAYPAERVSIAAYGPYRPVADNGTEEGRQQNRRVDLVVMTAAPLGPVAKPSAGEPAKN